MVGGHQGQDAGLSWTRKSRETRNTSAPPTHPPAHLYRAGHALLQRRLHGLAQELSNADGLPRLLQQLDLPGGGMEGAKRQCNSLAMPQQWTVACRPRIRSRRHKAG